MENKQSSFSRRRSFSSLNHLSNSNVNSNPNSMSKNQSSSNVKLDNLYGEDNIRSPSPKKTKKQNVDSIDRLLTESSIRNEKRNPNLPLPNSSKRNINSVSKSNKKRTNNSQSDDCANIVSIIGNLNTNSNSKSKNISMIQNNITNNNLKQNTQSDIVFSKERSKDRNVSVKDDIDYFNNSDINWSNERNQIKHLEREQSSKKINSDIREIVEKENEYNHNNNDSVKSQGEISSKQNIKECKLSSKFNSVECEDNHIFDTLYEKPNSRSINNKISYINISKDRLDNFDLEETTLEETIKPKVSITSQTNSIKPSDECKVDVIRYEYPYDYHSISKDAQSENFNSERDSSELKLISVSKELNSNKNIKHKNDNFLPKSNSNIIKKIDFKQINDEKVKITKFESDKFAINKNDNFIMNTSDKLITNTFDKYIPNAIKSNEDCLVIEDMNENKLINSTIVDCNTTFNDQKDKNDKEKGKPHIPKSTTSKCNSALVDTSKSNHKVTKARNPSADNNKSKMVEIKPQEIVNSASLKRSKSNNRDIPVNKNQRIFERKHIQNTLVDFDSLRKGIDQDIENQYKIVKPVDSNSLIFCTLEREKSILNGSTFRLTLSNTGGFILNARKMNASFTSYYHLSMKDKVFHKDDGQVGKVRSDFAGEVYHFYSRGQAQSKVLTSSAASSKHNSPTKNTNPSCSLVQAEPDHNVREELGGLQQEVNFHQKGPAGMKVVLPQVAGEMRSSFQSNRTSMIDQLRSNTVERMFLLASKKAVWDPASRNQLLDFQGRVQKPSSKNFQLKLIGDASEDVILQFGKVSDDIYHLDFKFPFSPLQALSTCLPTFDFKLIE